MRSPLLECRQLGPVGTTPAPGGPPIVCTRVLGHEGLHASPCGNQAGFIAWSDGEAPE